jgi:cell division protein FtsB
MQAGGEPELETLAARIAEVRAEIDGLKAERARIEASASPPTTDPEVASLETLRAQVHTARARASELARSPTTASRSTLEASARNSLYAFGTFIALPGLVTLALMVGEHLRHPEEKLEPMLLGVFAVPLLLGLAFIARARFSRYRPETQDLDGDFL